MPELTEFVADAEKLNQLENMLVLVSEAKGDITLPVLGSYFSRYPDAEKVFQKYPPARRAQLQQEMVETALYCLMTWYERPMEIQILLSSSVAHHQDLNIPVGFFTGLLEVVLEVVGEALPAEGEQHQPFIADLRQQLLRAIELAAE